MSDFVICINNDSNPASLILGKAYRTLLTRNAWDFDPLRALMDVEFYAGDPEP